MKTKEKHLFLLLFLFLAACSGSEVIEKFPKVENKYDPSKPKEVTGMHPLTGRIDNNFVIEGNLGNNIEDMRVYFDDKKAVLLRTDGTTLQGLIPKQPDGFNKITVVLGPTEADSIITDIQFRYRQVQAITTIAGSWARRANWDPGNGTLYDGSLAECNFNFIKGVTVVAGNSILVSEGFNDLRLVSQEDEKVVTLAGAWSNKFGDGAVNQARDEAYLFDIDRKEIFQCSRSTGWYPAKVRGKIEELPGEVWGMTFGKDDRYIYLRDHTGKFGRLDTETEGLPFETLLQTEGDMEVQARICYSKVSDCFYFNSFGNCGISKIWQDETTGEWKSERFAGYNGSGLTEGKRLTEARFARPAGMCVDLSGNIYVACEWSQSIMRINLKSDYVEHVAGVWEDQWNQQPPVNGKPLESRMHNPLSIFMDDEENFIIGCENDGEIRKFSIE